MTDPSPKLTGLARLTHSINVIAFANPRFPTQVLSQDSPATSVAAVAPAEIRTITTQRDCSRTPYWLSHRPVHPQVFGGYLHGAAI